MAKLSQRNLLLASTILCGASVIGGGQVYAQTAPSSSTTVGEVIVTGSRIPRANLVSASPVTVVTAKEIKAEGIVNVESLLNNLPSVFAGQNATVSNGSSGTATVDLRALGPARTLVLIDGRRLQAGDPGTPVPDLNFIPSSLVDRVDVLTGGAAATYGADAVAGVVNFVMKRDFEGVQVDVTHGFDQHTNHNGEAAHNLAANAAGPIAKPGNVWESGDTQVSFVVGANSPDHSGNVTAYAQYNHLDPILQSSRDFSACSLTDTGSVNQLHKCSGSSNSAFGRINLLGAVPNPQTVPPTPKPGSGTGQIGASLTNFGAAPGTFHAYSGAAAFNYGPFNYFQRSDERYNLGSFAHYEINKHFNVYMDAMMMDDHTVAQIAPSGFFQTSGTYYIPCNNAFLSAAQATNLGCSTPYVGGGALAPAGTPVGSVATTIGYRFAGSNRQDDLRHTDYRIVVGTKGEIADGWSYDLYGQYGAAVYNEHYLNDASVSKLQNALNTKSTTQCVTSDPKCVPINIFGGGVSQAALAYVLTPGFKTGQTIEQIVELDINGDLGKYGIKSPAAEEGVKLAVGADYRREQLNETVDNEYATGDLSGSGGATPPASGAFGVHEVYGEIHAPLVSGMPVFKALNLDLGYRYSEYSNVGDASTYKVALDWAVVDDVKLRASYNRAVRAPNIDELYQPDTVGLYSGSDPCANNKTTGVPTALLPACELSGVTPAQYGSILNCPAGQCNKLGGGNIAVRPETADTKSFGVVFTPTLIHNFSVTVDYYDIKVTNVITSISPGTSLNNCLAGQLTYCQYVHRDANGSIGSPTGYIIAINQNTGSLATKGVDVEADYRTKMSDIMLPDFGTLGLNVVGTYTSDYLVQNLTGGATYDCANHYGTVCGNPQPHWRSKVRVTWTTPWNWELSAQWRYVGAVRLDTNSPNPLLANGYYDTVDNKLQAKNYFDLSGNWRIKDGLSVRGGINNVFDTDPPIISGAGAACQTGPCNGNTYPGVYDSLGRTMFVGLTAKF